MARKRKPVDLKSVLLLDAVILIIITAFILFLETRVTEYTQRENLLKRLDSITETLSTSYQETLEVTEIYQKALEDKAESLAYLMDNEPDLVIDE